MKPFLAILLLCTGAAILYGVIHDQVTARICLEYFTIGHPRVLASDSPTLHALFWGVAATWWAGLISGAIIAMSARFGRWPRLGAHNIWPLVVSLLVVMGLAATGVGMLTRSLLPGYEGANRPMIIRGREVPEHRKEDYAVCAFAHVASYQVGFAGTVVVSMVIIAWRGVKYRRGRMTGHQTPYAGA